MQVERALVLWGAVALVRREPVAGMVTVELAQQLQAVGVEALDATGNLRPLGDILLELGQSMQGSVTETPYSSADGSSGMSCLPACRLLSIIRPMIDRLPAAICAATSRATSGWRSWSLSALAWLQSTMMFGGD